MFKDSKQKFEEIKKLPEGDYKHILKRTISFDRLDQLLSSCKDGKCPIINEYDIYFLVDISLDGYVNDRAYYYFKDSLLGNDDDRYKNAKERINIVFKCKKKPKIDQNVFDKDYNEIAGEKFLTSIRRKAFWISLKYQYESNHNPNLDFCGAFGFISTVKEGHESLKSGNFHIDNFRSYLNENLHACNGLDLFRICYFRQKLDLHPSTKATQTALDPALWGKDAWSGLHSCQKLMKCEESNPGFKSATPNQQLHRTPNNGRL